VCSMRVNSTFETGLAEVKRTGDKQWKSIEKRLAQFAADASVERPGRLDDKSDRLRGMPTDLQEVSHVRIGRHRVYFVGNHSKCEYFAFFVKVFKKTEKLNESDPRTQETLRQALKLEGKRELRLEEDAAPNEDATSADDKAAQ
jgi:hypothetical protein